MSAITNQGSRLLKKASNPKELIAMVGKAKDVLDDLKEGSEDEEEVCCTSKYLFSPIRKEEFFVFLRQEN